MNQFDFGRLQSEVDAEAASIEADRMRLSEREHALEVKREALRMLERLHLPADRSDHVAQIGVNPQGPAQSSDVIDLSELETDSVSNRRTFVDEVRDVVRRFGKQEFTNAHVEAAMKRLGMAIKGNTPRSRISLTFGKLVDEGVLIKTFVGGGNVPHRYRLRSTLSEAEIAHYEAACQETSSPSNENEDQSMSEDQDSPGPENVLKLA